MTISDTQKTDFLWKKIQYGVTETNVTPGKEGYNETIASPIPVLTSSIWTDSSQIPAPAAAVSGIVAQYTTTTAVRFTPDPTVAGNKTWIATSTFGTLSTRIGDWISPAFDPTYLIQVYTANPNPTPGATLNQGSSGTEWVFDYSAGVLTFPNALPGGTTQIWVVGYRYIGAKGFSSSSTTVVADITARDALNATATIGQQVYVIDASGDTSSGATIATGEYALYIYTATNTWSLVGTKNSARSDSKSLNLTLNGSAPTGTYALGTAIGTGVRVVISSIDVTSGNAFDGNGTITIGDAATNDRLMLAVENNPQSVGTYVTNSPYYYNSSGETQLNVYWTKGTTTTGTANITVTYA